MKKALTTLLLAITAILCCPTRLAAQEDYRFDIGGGIGMTGYLGDANPSFIWQSPSWDLELLLRYIANPRWAFKTNFYVGGLRGDSQNMANVLPTADPLKFSTTFYELGEMAEFNFFNYGMGERYRKLKRFSPYITAGLSATIWTVGGETSGSFTLPFGIGAKFKINRRLNLGVEFLMKKVFTDRLDGPQLDDPLAIESSFVKNTDWYSTLTFTLSYEFSKRCATCHYKD
ncbi:MAG: porin family protein [Muribaculaceae bacterium]|nr:porin family protein [Muribaculaceae bacterium]MDE7509848.1 porin family protein [Muribaculaceae bacterium]